MIFVVLTSLSIIISGSIHVAENGITLVPVIQPPIMKALTTKKERTVVMKQLRTVSKTEKIIFPIMVTIVVSLIVPDAAVLVGYDIDTGKQLAGLRGADGTGLRSSEEFICEMEAQKA